MITLHRLARRSIPLALLFLGPWTTGTAQTPRVLRDTVLLSQPTLLAFFLANPAIIDSNPSGDLAATADDFAYYLGTAIPTLDSMGVQVKQTLDSAVALRDSANAILLFSVLGADSLPIGYWLLGAGRAPRYLGGGVRTDLDLIQAVSEYFGPPASPGCR